MIPRKTVPLLVLVFLFVGACTRQIPSDGTQTPASTKSSEQIASMTALVVTPAPSPTATKPVTATAEPTASPTATPAPIISDLPLDHPSREKLVYARDEGYLKECQEDPLMICPEKPSTFLEGAITAVRIIDPDFDPNEPSEDLHTPEPMNITYVYLHTPDMRGEEPSEEEQRYVEHFIIELGMYVSALQCNPDFPSIVCLDMPLFQDQGGKVLRNLILNRLEAGASTGGG